MDSWFQDRGTLINNKRDYTSINAMQNYVFHKQIELCLVVLIIAVLAVLQIKSYMPAILFGKTVHSIGAPFQNARIDITYYYAYHGEWPKDNKQALEFGWHDQYLESEDYAIEDIQIKDGAFNMQFDEFLDGKIITLRPAIPAGDPFGPIIWVIGNNRAASEWQVFGEDRTNIENQYISTYAR